MTDRNTISQVVESLFEDWIDKNINVHPLAVENMRILEADALALLKEQEAVEPKQVDLYGNDEWWGLVCVCTDCNAEWMTDKANTHFCPNCGRPVKWE